MGNRALIATEKKDIEIYVHWNGGRESVTAFLDYCKAMGFRAPENDCYGWARLCQVIGNFFGGTGSVGICKYAEMDADFCDNGRYTIKDWEIVAHTDEDGELDFGHYAGMMREINDNMPEKEKLTEEELDRAIRARMEKW